MDNIFRSNKKVMSEVIDFAMSHREELRRNMFVKSISNMICDADVGIGEYTKVIITFERVKLFLEDDERNIEGVNVDEQKENQNV